MSDDIEYTVKELRAIADEIDLRHLHGQIGRPTQLRLAADYLERLTAENQELRKTLTRVRQIAGSAVNDTDLKVLHINELLRATDER